MNLQEGMSAPLEGSYCVRVLSGQLPPWSPVRAATHAPGTCR